MTPAWEDFVRAHFPGYLLPESAPHALSVEEATLFLERLTGRPHELALLRAVSTISPRMDALRAFAFRVLPELVRALPSLTEITQREWEGGFQGRLELRPTLAYWAAGQRTRFVTRARERSFALPENVLVRAVTERLLGVLADLRQGGVLGASGWGADVPACEGQLRHLLASTVLREVPAEPLESRHEEAAHAGRHPCHTAALDWHRALRGGLDDRDPVAIAAVLANGALNPLDEPTRFEIAVVIKLVKALWERTEQTGGGRWTLHRCLVRRGRHEVAALERDDGAAVRVYYNQSHLAAGPCDLGARHYFGHTGRMRPDVTVVAEKAGEKSAAVIEIKLTEDSRYIVDGFHEAMLYRWEYARLLRGWPKAILVTLANVQGPVREEDDVVAVGWNGWVPEKLVDGLLKGAGDSFGAGHQG
jgi:hypothetical protein